MYRRNADQMSADKLVNALPTGGASRKITSLSCDRKLGRALLEACVTAQRQNRIRVLIDADGDVALVRA